MQERGGDAEVGEGGRARGHRAPSARPQGAREAGRRDGHHVDGDVPERVLRLRSRGLHVHHGSRLWSGTAAGASHCTRGG